MWVGASVGLLPYAREPVQGEQGSRSCLWALYVESVEMGVWRQATAHATFGGGGVQCATRGVLRLVRALCLRPLVVTHQSQLLMGRGVGHSQDCSRQCTAVAFPTEVIHSIYQSLRVRGSGGRCRAFVDPLRKIRVVCHLKAGC